MSDMKVARLNVMGKFTKEEEQWILDSFTELLKQVSVNVKTKHMHFELSETRDVEII